MAKIIDYFIDQNEKVITFLDQIGRDFENADKNFEIFKAFLDETKYNAVLGIDLANFMQVLDKVESIKDFELIDIRQLFSSLIKTQEFNIDTYLEAGHFEWAVMDDKQRAIEIITNGLNRATQKTEELKRLLDKIQDES